MDGVQNFFFQHLPVHLPPSRLSSPAVARPFLLSLVLQQGAPARAVAVASKSLRSNAGPKTAAPSLPWLHRCFVLSSEQHAVDARRVFAVFAQPHPRRLSPPERHPVFCEEKASRSTLVDVRNDAQIGITIVLTNTDWVCLWTER
ncbi:uncharacterized protein [Zea mays]|uniref:uncharacterized protein n=1 Tax=Zea mays TaxID=4577 RepID=UPI001651CCB1|nr:uncharacterized protein LOC109939908 [Zea mays]